MSLNVNADEFGLADTVSSIPEETWDSQPSPYYSCTLRKTSTDHGRVWNLQRQIPVRDKRDIKTKDFLLALADKVEAAAADNLKMTKSLTQCFSVVFRTHASENCREMRQWALPPKENPETPDKDSLWYNVRASRAHLALSSGNRLSSAEATTINRKLNPLGSYKNTHWNELDDAELAKAQKNMDVYKKQFQKLKSLTDTQMQDLVNLRNQQGHQLRKEYLHEFRKMRRKHLDEYRKIISKFPLINYLSSPQPTEAEIYSAGMRMQENAQSELARIRDLKKILRELKTDVIPNSTLLLTDYGGLVEGLLSERPEFCAVATSTYLVRGERELGNAILMTAPLLAATVLAPPMAAVAISVAASTAYAGLSYIEFKDKERAHLTTPIDNGTLRADYQSVDEANSYVKSELIMIPIDGALGGIASKLATPLRKSISNSGN